MFDGIGDGLWQGVGVALILFLVQAELTGEVAAMTIAPVECKPEQLGGGGEL